MMSNEQQKALVLRAQRGDELAFETLYKEYKKVIYSRVYEAVRNKQDAEDVTQKIFFNAFRFIKKMRLDAMFSTWLYSICVNEIAVFFREILAQKRAGDFTAFSLETGNDEESDEKLAIQKMIPTIDQNLAMVAAKVDIEKAINLLPNSYRRVMELRAHGDSVEEIAEKLHVVEGTVKGYLARARQQMNLGAYS